MTAAATKARPAAKKAPVKKAMPAASRTKAGPRTAAPPAVEPDLSAVQLLPLTLLDDHPDNPPGRSVPDEDLVASVRSVGLLQPLLVTPGEGDRFTIVAGHRRRAALVVAGRTEALCQVRADMVGARVDVAMAVENGRRKGLGSLEEAALYARLRDRDSLSQRQIGEQVGVNQSHVSRLLSLLRLPDTARAAVALEQVSVQDAAQLAQYADRPEAFAAGWEQLTRGYGSKSAVRTAQGLVDAQVLRDKLTAAGVTLVTTRPGYDGPGPVMSYYVGVTETKHAKLDCHAVYVSDEGQQSWCCTKPKSHPKQGRGGGGGADAKAREDARERKKAMKARVEAGRLLEAIPVAPAAAAPLLARALANRMGHAETMTIAIAWMQANCASGLGVLGNGSLTAQDAAPYTVEKWILEHGDERLVIRYGCALALAAQEIRARDQYGRWGAEQALYLWRLARDAGYHPSPWEQTRLRDQVRVLDVEAFLNADDPGPHLPGQPTLHEDLGTEPATQLLEDGVA